MSLTFEQFRAKLADVVTVAINSGKRVRAILYDGKTLTYCPLGCHPESPVRRPGTIAAMGAFNVDSSIVNGFMNGFDGNRFDSSDDLRSHELGRLYRRRFGGKP